jgi:LCP family protein required for cell wall assembly
MVERGANGDDEPTEVLPRLSGDPAAEAGPEATGPDDPEPQRPAGSGPPAGNSRMQSRRLWRRKQARVRRRRSRRAKVFIGIAASLAIIVAVAAVVAGSAYRHLNGNIHQADITPLLGPQPVDHHTEAQNIAVIGSDTRHGQGRGYGSVQELSTDQSDTLLIVHIAADRTWASVMSIPRDSWVSIPSCLMGDGQHSSPHSFKINEAFALGNMDGNHTVLGVACTIKTLEQNTGIHIDHFAVINFSGLRDMVRALGGVPECNTTPINDPLSGLQLSAGHHVLTGFQALAYVRARYTLGNGSDLDRIKRQQAFMSSLVQRARSKLLDPLAIYRFLDAATKSLTIDTQMGGIHGLYSLGRSLADLPTSQVTFFTLPTFPRSAVDPSDTANVLWTQPLDSQIFAAFQDDVPVSQALLDQAQAGRLPARQVRVTVLNGTGQPGLAYTVAAQLREYGYRIRAAHDLPRPRTRTSIRYGSGLIPQATRLAGTVPGAVLRSISPADSSAEPAQATSPDPMTTSGQPSSGERAAAAAAAIRSVVLVLGTDYGTAVPYISAPAVTPAAPADHPASDLHSRTASQGICT